MTSHDIATILIESGNFEGQMIEDSKMQSFCVVGDSRYPNNLPSLKLTCSPLKKSPIPKGKETSSSSNHQVSGVNALLVFGRLHHSNPCPKNTNLHAIPSRYGMNFSQQLEPEFFQPLKIGDSPNLEIIFHPPEKLRFGTPTKMEIWLEDDDVPDFQIWGSSGAFAVSFRESLGSKRIVCPELIPQGKCSTDLLASNNCRGGYVAEFGIYATLQPYEKFIANHLNLGLVW